MTSSRSPRIAAVVCTHNRSALLCLALDSLCAQTLPGDDYEVVVVDNASTDETASIVQRVAHRYGNVRYIYEGRPGLSWARNTGARATSAPYLAYLDDDARAGPTWLESILRAHEQTTPQPAAVGGPVRLDWGAAAPAWLLPRFWSVYTYLDRGEQARFIGPEEYLVGANLSVRRDILLAIAGFDTRLGRQGTNLLSGEETALLAALRQRNLPIYYEPAAVIWHMVPAERRSRRWLWRRMFWDGASQPLIDYGGGQTRRFYASQAYRDIRRIGFFTTAWLWSLRSNRGHQRLETVLAIAQRAGRFRSNLRLALGKDGYR